MKYLIALFLLLGTGCWIYPEPTAAEKEVSERATAAKGISVGMPKVYDDALLQQMLNDAMAKLAALQSLDQASIIGHYGAVTGATLTTSSLGINVQGAPAPGQSIVSNGMTNSTATTTPGASSPTSVVQTVGQPVQNVTTTVPQVSAPSAGAPAASTSLPTAFNVSAADVLNEQMQLTYEIANLRLLLEGSLTDRFVIDGDKQYVRPRLTLGFPVTIMPLQQYKNAVAVVEVEVTPEKSLKAGEKVVVTAILPREKTYNVAAITDKNVSLGGGVVTGAGIGGSAQWGFGRKTYYIVQDQDTLALGYQPTLAVAAGFTWQFRPVLRQDYVRSGMKQTFVQLSFPSPQSEKVFGRVRVRTYWCRYDRKRNLVQDVIPGTLKDEIQGWEAPHIDLPTSPEDFGPANLEDQGNGTMLVTLHGHFLTGTAVRIGTTILGQGSAGFTYDLTRIRFVAPICDLATKYVAIIGRDGSETRLHFTGRDFDEPEKAIKITSATVASLDDSNSLLTLELTNTGDLGVIPVAVLLGGQAYGFRDAPVQRDATPPGRITLVVPTALLAASREVTVTPLFATQRYRDKAKFTIPGYDPASQGEKLTLVAQSDKFTFLLNGSRLSDDTAVISPGGKTLAKIGQRADASTLRLLELSADEVKNYKEIILQRPGERPIPVAIPSVTPGAPPAPPQAKERVIVGADEAVLAGDALAQLLTVSWRGTAIPFAALPDGKSVRLTGLKNAGVTAVAGTQALDILLKSGKVSVNLEVVTAKVETVAK
ncbi:MAG: hypothetical protein LAP87_11665 [Acidobacteriia bacterium]|nr:hypothetical protein [Terriglobia bacterium]